MKTIQEKINETLTQIQNIHKVQTHYDDTQKELKMAYSELKRLDRIVGKELDDVEKLESMSMKAIFHKILGSKEEQIEKERQEYLQASLKYNEFKKSIEVLEYEKELLEKKLQDDTMLKEKLHKLKQLRENEILRFDTALANKLNKISKQMDKLFIQQQNIANALDASEKAERILSQIISELQKARQWGNWDMWSKGKMSDFLKYGAIDRAKNLSFQAKQQLHKLQNELAQIGVKTSYFSLNLDNFSRFTDIFFDNLISDWVIQQKIVNALANVKSVQDRVVRIRQSLHGELKSRQEAIAVLKEEREKILLS